MALDFPIFRSRLICDCKCTPDRLWCNNRVTLVWVASHIGITGNKRANGLAKKGVATALLGPEPAMGISRYVSRSVLRTWQSERHQDFWEEQTKTRCRQAKALLNGLYDGVIVKEIKKMNKADTSLITQLLTGHGCLNYHMFKPGISDGPSYWWCSREDETE